MPIAQRFHIEHVQEFALQMKRASRLVRKLQIESTAQLLNELDDDSLYPFDYIVYRITGYRAEIVDQPMLLGSAL
ncbi:MAG TPA: hypothetical protein EYO40_06325, partial [Phycisphaerales bacterium]|nr:hypothetical protein [Phycisphaerales bacterium]